jgi:hypothetical protein
VRQQERTGVQEWQSVGPRSFPSIEHVDGRVFLLFVPVSETDPVSLAERYVVLGIIVIERLIETVRLVV